MDSHQRTRILIVFGSPAARTRFLMFLLLLCCRIPGYAQSTASIEGQVVDQNAAVITAVEIKAINRSIAVERATVTDDAGRYQITALPVGDYRLEVRAPGFQTQVLENVRVEVGRRLTQDFQLRL